MPEVTLTSKLQPIDDDIVFADDDRPTMIQVDHVSMEFNMASEQLNSLKEYAIALFKRKLYFEKFTALDDVSFEVKKGDVFGILGTNGSGKSTLLKIIAGVLEPTKGKCDVNGNIAPLIELGAGFDMELSARENIYLNGALLGYSHDFIEEHFDDIVEFAEIEKFLDMPMKNYSSGMTARIAFAIATVMVPEILIVDEVLSVGDFMFQQKCEDRINNLINQYGVTVLIVSHSNDQIERLCNKAIWIEKGHTRIIGTATQVCNAYRILGGRSGNAKNEQIVFRALKDLESNINPYVQHEPILGEDHYQIAANTALAGWPDGSKNVVLIPDFTHAFAIIASGLAGALNAPIFPYNKEGVNPSVLNALLALKTENIYVIGSKEEYSKIVDDASIYKYVNNLFPIDRIVSDTTDNTGILGFGEECDLWDSDAAFISFFSDNFASFLASPLAFKMKAPYFVVDNNSMNLNNKYLEILKRLKITKLTTVGSIADSTLKQTLISEGFRISDISENVSDMPGLQISDFVAHQDGFKQENSLCVASSAESGWPRLLSLPSYCGKTLSTLILEDSTDLDNTAKFLEHISRCSFQKVTFISSNCMSPLDQNLILSTLNRKSI